MYVMDFCYNKNNKHNKITRTTTKCLGPLFVHMTGAIICLLFSSMFHLFSAYSPKAQKFMSRLDYGGISFLIAGSTFPPIIYGFACNIVPKIAYVLIINTTCFLAFVMMLIPGADTPKYRKVRGIMFIMVGLCAGIPAFHAACTKYTF